MCWISHIEKTQAHKKHIYLKGEQSIWRQNMSRACEQKPQLVCLHQMLWHKQKTVAFAQLYHCAYVIILSISYFVVNPEDVFPFPWGFINLFRRLWGTIYDFMMLWFQFSHWGKMKWRYCSQWEIPLSYPYFRPHHMLWCLVLALFDL